MAKAIGFFRSNLLTCMLLAGVACGALCGSVLGREVFAVKPVGDIFLNILFTVTVPLVFFTVASSFNRMCSTGKAGKIMVWTVIVLVLMILLSAFVGYVSCLLFPPVINAPEMNLSSSVLKSGGLSIGEAIVGALSVPDFNQLFSVKSMLPMIVVAVLTGLATSVSGEKGQQFAAFLESASSVLLTLVRLVMYASPLGLGCYFATVVAENGAQFMGSYLKIFLMFCVMTIFYFFVLNSVFILLASGKKGLKRYWSFILPPSITAFASGSSAVAMPGSIDAACKMGIDRDIAESVIPFGVNVHKDGSLMGAVIKVAFLVLVSGGSLTGFGNALTIMFVAIMSSVVMGAVPVGAMTGELLICSMLGLDPMLTGMIVIIGTIIDMPATMINSSTNVVAAVIVDRISSKSVNSSK